MVEYPAYVSDPASSDYHLLPGIKQYPVGHRPKIFAKWKMEIVTWTDNTGHWLISTKNAEARATMRLAKRLSLFAYCFKMVGQKCN